MKRLKLSIAALAIVLTVGVTYATGTSKLATGDCYAGPNGEADLPPADFFRDQQDGNLNSQTDCEFDGAFCCYLLPLSTDTNPTPIIIEKELI